MLQDMRGEFGSMSRKGFDVRFGYGMRSRSHKVVQDSSFVSVDAFKQSCWANMPPELLRDVLTRIEASEITWPSRKNVVACAASNDDGKFLLAAREIQFLGTKFTIYDAQPQPPNSGAKVAKCRSTRIVNMKQVSPRVPTGNYPVAHVSYELNVLGSRSKSTRTENLQSVPLAGYKDGMLVLRNKAPRWHEQLQCWCLNFNGRVTVASVKNFQLVASPDNGVGRPEHENVILQFGKVGKDVFTMDYQYPISAFLAFAICLSSFDTKIACE
ncbi:hypothetical protein GH714_024168 [Hevea brasiliensis]|uniref:Tubby C-terminal domain-containing protein n=1 Tax=Hevea brasiliensis TaxID=3981 RepID=A0A6A6LEQ1_HEVBR|nr:hypothetical protein GH714_024168 [Hevea brasiliensis]